MPRIAILLSGRINSFPRQYQNFKETFLHTGYDVDLFVSHPPGYSSSYIQSFIELYRPVKIKESDERIIDVSGYKKNPYTIIKNMMCMFLNRKYLYEMLTNYILENNIEYECIISSRCDLWSHDTKWLSLSIDEVIRSVKNDVILIPTEADHGGGINDQLCIMNLKNAGIYMNIYDNTLNLLNNKHVIVHPETLLREHLHYNGVNVQRFKMHYTLKYGGEY